MLKEKKIKNELKIYQNKPVLTLETREISHKLGTNSIEDKP